MTHPTYTFGRPADWSLIPPQMIGGIRRYVEHGIAPGHFLSAVFCNDLVEAFNRADEWNTKMMKNYVAFLYNYLPGECWGSRARFDAWCKSGGLAAKGWRAPENMERV